MLRPLSAALLSPILFIGMAARADLPEVAFGPSFDKLCGEIRAATSCDDCACSPLTSSIGPDSADVPYAVLVKLESKPGSDPVKTRFTVAVGNKDGLKHAGVIHETDSTGENTTYVDVEVKKMQTFDDTCLRCDHEGVGLVHIFDLVLKSNRMYQDEGYQMHDEKGELGVLLTCFGTPMACYGTPLSMSLVTDQPPMAPGDKGKKGVKVTWSRTWKIGGRNKMQVVLGPLTGNGAKTAKGIIDTDPNDFHFGEIPTRTHSVKAK